ncbi:hypothetical protein H1S01_19425 [Heliobacterium chlorum]|uniref:Uncharacterized protein n=1 Tax=Heliobacterium chlorum TaxID=2698 RepID=A0ABR7T778_HELCL|nr:hypothetical protein [Heliobacterium chlorum]MBC9786619.1 hypothetical protein [Heliobacterium chlorum]
MKFEGSNDRSVFARCDCGAFHRFDKNEVTIVDTNIYINDTYECQKCKYKHTSIDGYLSEEGNKAQELITSHIEAVKRMKAAAEEEIEREKHTVKCKKCGSSQVSVGDKGFGLGKAAIGGILLGPVGLLGGLVGSKKTVIICLKCGHRWEVGK